MTLRNANRDPADGVLVHCWAGGERRKRKLMGGIPRQRPVGEARVRGPAWTVGEWAGSSTVFLFLFIPKVI